MLQYNFFLNMILPSITEFQWRQKPYQPTFTEQILHSCPFMSVDAFSHFDVTVPIKSNNVKTAVKSLLHHWITNFGPIIFRVTFRGSKQINTDVAQLDTLMGIRHSSRTLYSPWTNGLVEVQNKNLGPHIRMFVQNTMKVGLIKSTCTLVPTINNLSLLQTFLFMKLFFIHVLEFHSHST